MAATAGAAAEIVREIAAVGAADLAAMGRWPSPPPRKVSCHAPRFRGRQEAGQTACGRAEAAQVADLLRAPLRVEMGTRRPLVLQMVQDPTSLDPAAASRCVTRFTSSRVSPPSFPSQIVLFLDGRDL
ncbi:hypothetical protein ZWY2020_054428 [Hordeum vulgare]|nr:hypothetical protein ZWY2020_054428 [Hordeum vulgare]